MGVLRGEELRTRCPLHQDTNPSFSLNVRTGLWICFAKCGGGEFTELVERVLSMSPTEARDWIESNGKRVSSIQLYNKLQLELNQQPNAPYYLPPDAGWRIRYANLTDKVMPLWFLKRGFSWDTIWHYEIRYDPVWDSVTIPVVWEKEMVGTVTRNTHSSLPKYQNSPDLPRSEILFGEISGSSSNIILVEGVLDALWLWQCGYNAGGLLGTYLADKQIKILKGYKFGEIVLALDNDEAGMKGTQEARRRLIKAGWLPSQISIMRFPEGMKDAQDCWPEELEQLYAHRKGVLAI